MPFLDFCQFHSSFNFTFTIHTPGANSIQFQVETTVVFQLEKSSEHLRQFSKVIETSVIFGSRRNISEICVIWRVKSHALDLEKYGMSGVIALQTYVRPTIVVSLFHYCVTTCVNNTPSVA